MADLQDRRPAKQRKTQGQPLFEDIEPTEDDGGSSITSSASTGELQPVRLPQRLARMLGAPGADQTSTTENDDEGSEERTPSSQSVDSDEDTSSDDESSDNTEARFAVNDSENPGSVRPPVSDLRSRLQQFLPQLQQAKFRARKDGRYARQAA